MSEIDERVAEQLSREIKDLGNDLQARSDERDQLNATIADLSRQIEDRSNLLEHIRGKGS